MIYLPLILCGAELIFKEKKNYLLTISVFFAAVTGFYFLYMTSIFLAVYAVLRLSMIHGADLKKISCSCLKCLFFYAIGIMLASPILISSLGGFLGSERNSLGFMNAILDMKTWILDSSFLMLSKLSDFFSGDEPIVKLASIIEVFAIILLFFRKNTKTHIIMKISVLVILVLIQIPFTGYIFNSFGETNLRWIFIVHFIFAFISVYILQDLEEVNISFNNGENFQLLKKAFFTFMAVISVFTCGNNFSSAIFEIGDFAKKTEIEKLTDSPFRNFEIERKDLFRVSNEPLLDNGRPENIAMINNYNGLNYWFSIINSNTQNFVDEVYKEKQDWRSFGMNGNPTYETLCGVKYFMSPSEDNSRNYIFLGSKNFNGTKWNLFENPNFFGMAYKIGSEKEKLLTSANGNFEEYLKSLIKLISEKGLGVDLSYDKGQDSFSANFSTEENNSELTVLIPFSRNWKVFVDGTETECKKADKMFMSVSIKDSGNHSVRFIYRNSLFRYGLLLSVIGILFIATEIILRKKFQR